MNRRTWAWSGCLMAMLTWSVGAQATPEFPGVVVATLGLDAGITIGPPMGCTLCHTTDSGGTSLRSFGQLLLHNGAAPYDDGSLKAALMAVEKQCPILITDIKDKKDPNNDTCTAQSSTPTPEYGCALRGRRSPSGSAWLGALGGLGAFAWRRRAKRKRRLDRLQ